MHTEARSELEAASAAELADAGLALELPVGTWLLGRYRVLGPALDSGGRGPRAHRVRDELLGGERRLRLLAGERVTPRGAEHPGLQGRLRHRHLEAVHACERVEVGPPAAVGAWALVTAPRVGETLAALARAERLAGELLARIGLAALSALDALARLGLAHGALAPERIEVAADGAVRLLEPGLGALDPGALDPALRAPELPAGEPADPRADLYALGATLYLAASGRPPDRPSPLPLSDLRPDLPAALARGVGLLLQEDPRARADLAAAGAAFAAALGEAPAPAEALPAAVEPAFVGRAEALAAAAAALEDAQALAALGRAARGARTSAAAPLLEVVAAEGLGKSRLLEEAALQLARRGARALRAQAFVGGDPYGCWRPLIALASEGRDDPLAARAREAVAAASPLGPEARHEHVARFLVALAGERPVAVLVDDAHLLAPAAADLVAHLARAAVSPESGGALALILARRPDAAEGDEGQGTPLGRALAAPLTPRGRRVTLGELAPAEARALVASVLLGAPADEVDRLARLGGGSPFLLVELTREWRLGGGTPATVFDSVTARLARLSPRARALAEALAAIGRPLRLATARALAGGADAPALAELLEVAVLERAGERLRFRHGVTREVLLDALDEAQRADRCRRALAALEQEQDDPEASEGERARLALAAGAPGAAERALRAAAGDPTPEELYRGALALLPPGPERARAGEAYAARLLTRGAFDEARQALDAAAADLDGQDPVLAARLQLARSRVARAEGDTHQALRWATRAQALLAPDGPEPGALPPGAAPLLAELEAALAEVATARGDHAGAARLYARAERWAEAAQDPRLSATLRLREAGALVLALDRARYGEARARVAEARALLEPLDPAQAELDAERTLGNLAWYEGDPAGAEAHFRRALELAEQQANLTLSAGLLNNLGLVGQAQGKLSQAEAFLERALDIAERVGQPAVLCRAYTNVGRVRRALGDPRGAARSFRRAARVARAAGDPLIESAALSELGRTRLGERRTAAALDALQRSERLRLALGDVGRVAESQLELGELWRAAGDVGAALAHTGRALALRAALGSPDEAAEAVEALEFAVGRPGGPAALLEAARRPLRFAGAPPPVQAALERGAPLARLALRTLAAALCARAGDLEQAAAHAEQARAAARALEEASAGVGALAEALTLEAEAVVLAAQGRTDAALARLDQALAGQEAAGSGRATLRAGALRLKRAFLCLVRRDVAGAGRPWSDPEGPPLAPTLAGPLAERRAIGLALLGAAVRRAGRELDAPELLSLAAAEQAARRLGDVALLALVASARAEEAAASGSPHEAALERAAAEAAARRLADGLPDGLRRGLERAAAPAVAPAARAQTGRGEAAAPERLLATMTRVLASGLELEPLLGAALDALLEATGAPRGLVALVEVAGEPAVRVARGLEPGALAEEAAARAIVAHVAREGLSVDLEDAAARGGRFARGRKTPRAVLALPLRSGGGAPFGVVYLDHPRARGAFDEAARQLARALVATLCGPLEAALRRHERVQELTRRAEALRETARELSGTSAAPALVGRSPAMRALQRLIERYGRTSAAVTIMGESGTGKELVAKALHLASPRKDGPFIVLNCAAIPDSLLESELFGVIKGAFTGADRTRQGLFELAHEGTLFLDEVGDMGLDMQAKLLRVLETGELRPVGGRALVRVDVRIISATHHDLRRLSREGRFREDLLYRLNVLRIELPPLRERSEDLLLLAEHFLSLQAGGGTPKRLGPAALEKLMRHPFPGNVRELRNVIERACILEPGPTIEAERLVLDPAGDPGAALGDAPDYHKTFEHAGVPLNRRQRRLLDHLTGGVGAITNREYCALVGVSERTGLRDLTELVEHGLLRRLGRRKGARYHLPER